VDRGDLLAMKRLLLTQGQWNSMELHIETCLPLEACGLLAGTGDVVRRVMPVTNQARSPVKFRMEPAEQLRAFNWIDENSMELLGIFHSHPEGPTDPSPTDIAEAAFGVVYVIWSRLRGPWIANGFWMGESSISDVKLDVADVE
jgi:proteasome lid subunit RPN8/RPN11